MTEVCTHPILYLMPCIFITIASFGIIYGIVDKMSLRTAVRFPTPPSAPIRRNKRVPFVEPMRTRSRTPTPMTSPRRSSRSDSPPPSMPHDLLNNTIYEEEGDE